MRKSEFIQLVFATVPIESEDGSSFSNSYIWASAHDRAAFLANAGIKFDPESED